MIDENYINVLKLMVCSSSKLIKLISRTNGKDTNIVITSNSMFSNKNFPSQVVWLAPIACLQPTSSVQNPFFFFQLQISWDAKTVKIFALRDFSTACHSGRI